MDRLTRRAIVRFLLVVVAGILLLSGAFVLNGLVLASRTTPVTGTTTHSAAPAPLPGSRIRVMTYNIAKAFLHRGGLDFEPASVVRARLARIAAVVNAESPDLLFLQEAVFACAPCPVNQVVETAEATGMHAWAFGENFNIGLPFLTIAGGNAILSRSAITPVGNPDLPGRKPFWVSTNNRRMLWCSMQAGDDVVLLGAVHADSFSLKGGASHLERILGDQGDRPAILAGDFNAEAKDTSMHLVKQSGRFSGEIDGGEPSHPAPRPRRRIDFVLAPRAWEHVATRVINSDASDHAAVVADFVVR